MDRKKILVVDDETEFLYVLKEMLEPRGFDVTVTTNAVEAGIFLAERKPDLILMDIKMPGINGFQACEVIKSNKETKNIPIVIVTGLSDEDNIIRAKELGLLDYFVKPIDMDKLVRRINIILKIS